MSIDFLPFLKIAPIFFVALALPGPDFLFVSATALARGRHAGFMAAAGIATGLLFYCGVSVWGIGVLFSQMAPLIQWIKIAGGAYLLYLGFQLWRGSFHPPSDDVAQTPAGFKGSPYISGILTNLTNPKAIAFFGSIFALIITTETNVETKIATTFLCSLMAFGWFAFVAATLSVPRVRRRYEGLRRVIDRTAGTLLAAFGAKLLFSDK